MTLLLFVALVCTIAPFSRLLTQARPTEQERVQLWHEAGNTWPPSWRPENEQWKEAMRQREEELMMLPGADERWENWMQFTQSRMIPRFTPLGFKLIPTPPEIQAKLKEALDRGLTKFENLRNESQIDAVYTPIPSKFIDLHGLQKEIMKELKPLHEEWSGMELEGTSVYGLRLYRNGSSLVMHYDKVYSHVISSIIHVGHEYDDDNNPWPIEIEDHNGVIHAVNLEPGQMLFYESAACVHGRREIFRGKYYAGLFVHYKPVDKSIWDFSVEDVIANVPPHWRNDIIEDHGSRWSGQGLTIDSLATKGAKPRVIEGQTVPDLKTYWEARRKSGKKNRQEL